MKQIHVLLVPPATFFCSHCGETYKMAMPAPLGVLTAALKAFSQTHTSCKLSARGEACSACFGFGHKREDCPGLQYAGDLDKWWDGADTGTSSQTIVARLTGRHLERRSYPRDPSDFGRCYRLLMAFPALRQRLGEMRSEPGWRRLVEAWPELEALWLEESTGAMAPKLYRRMQELIG